MGACLLPLFIIICSIFTWKTANSLPLPRFPHGLPSWRSVFLRHCGGWSIVLGERWGNHWLPKGLLLALGRGTVHLLKFLFNISSGDCCCSSFAEASTPAKAVLGWAMPPSSPLSARCRKLPPLLVSTRPSTQAPGTNLLAWNKSGVASWISRSLYCGRSVHLDPIPPAIPYRRRFSSLEASAQTLPVLRNHSQSSMTNLLPMTNMLLLLLLLLQEHPIYSPKAVRFRLGGLNCFRPDGTPLPRSELRQAAAAAGVPGAAVPAWPANLPGGAAFAAAMAQLAAQAAAAINGGGGGGGAGGNVPAAAVAAAAAEGQRGTACGSGRGRQQEPCTVWESPVFAVQQADELQRFEIEPTICIGGLLQVGAAELLNIHCRVLLNSTSLLSATGCLLMNMSEPSLLSAYLLGGGQAGLDFLLRRTPRSDVRHPLALLLSGVCAVTWQFGNLAWCCQCCLLVSVVWKWHLPGLPGLPGGLLPLPRVLLVCSLSLSCHGSAAHHVMQVELLGKVQRQEPDQLLYCESNKWGCGLCTHVWVGACGGVWACVHMCCSCKRRDLAAAGGLDSGGLGSNEGRKLALSLAGEH